MLVLSRKKDQSIRINDDIVITITQIKGQQVRIGVEAPQDVTIRRGELCEFADPVDSNQARRVIPAIQGLDAISSRLSVTQ